MSAYRYTFFGFLIAVALAGCSDESTNQAPSAPSTQVAAVQTPKPAYPLELACAGVGGTVTLGLTVGVAGKPTEVRLVQGSGNEALDQLAQQGVREWQFNPATRNGQPVAQSIQVPVSFNPPQVRPNECFALEAQP